MNNTADIRQVNSVSYSDVAGLQLGLARLPGELTNTYMNRLYRATTSRRDHTYEGMLDELTLELGLNQSIGMILSSDDPGAQIHITPGRMALTAFATTSVISTVYLDSDNYMVWRSLGEVAQMIPGTGFTVELLADSKLPALQIAKQSNVITVINEPVTGTEYHPVHDTFLVESALFNQSVPAWVFEGAKLQFASAVPANTSVSYQYGGVPFEVVIGEVGMFGLMEPSLSTVAVGANGTLSYQLREFIQTLMQNDRSYWKK